MTPLIGYVPFAAIGPSATSYQLPGLLYWMSFILPAPANPAGTNATEPTDDATPSGVKLSCRSGAVLPGFSCPRLLSE
jgi:hypothetical protein